MVTTESWWPLSAWLSPGTAMFLFFNALVGAVAVMSRGQQGQQGSKLCRSASSMVLGRLRSFSSMFSGHPAAEWYDDYCTTAEAGELHTPEQTVPELAAAEPPHTPAVPAAAGAPASVPVEEKCTGSNAAAEPSPPAASAADEATVALAEESPAKEAPAESSRNSKRCALACRREAEAEAMEGKAELNARAEQFIHQFKEDLKLQRLNSILNYTRALRRCSGAALSSQE